MKKAIHFEGRPVWAEISLKAIEHNLRVIQKHMAPRKPKILAVVKSNAYGLGAVPIAKTLQKAGTEWFGVTCANEGIELREAGIKKRILEQGIEGLPEEVVKVWLRLFEAFQQS